MMKNDLVTAADIGTKSSTVYNDFKLNSSFNSPSPSEINQIIEILDEENFRNEGETTEYDLMSYNLDNFESLDKIYKELKINREDTLKKSSNKMVTEEKIKNEIKDNEIEYFATDSLMKLFEEEDSTVKNDKNNSKQIKTELNNSYDILTNLSKEALDELFK